MKHPEYQYLDLVQDILDHGVKKVDRGTGDASYSVFGRQIRFDLSKGFPLLTTKKVYWKGVLHELYWFMSGQSNIKYLIDNNVHIWDDYPYRIYIEKSRQPSAIGHQIMTKEEFIEIQEIKDDPAAHNLIVNSWNPEYLYSMATLKEASRFPICHNMYQVNIIDGTLSLQLYQRSADIFLGVPFNIASYALLTLILAKVTGYQPGEFIHTFGDVHIYKLHLNQVKEQLKRVPKKFPRIRFNKAFQTIDDFKPHYAELVDYDPHPPIKASLSVTGGLYDQNLKLIKKLKAT